MKYTNPVIKGFYADPSVCKCDKSGKYYLVTSTMQYFPGVPLLESDDLVNWTHIGNCLTRPSQIKLETVGSSGGVFAPTIRCNNGRFYMTTTNSTTQENFYVWTDDIYGEWSDPVDVEQGGIDPSLYFEDGKAFFMSNGVDDNGIDGITMCEINIETGKKLSPSKSIWQGTGGRYLEAPHLYKINGRYLLLAAEGGTEFGHMVTYAMSDNPFGPFTPYPKNPVLTNRDRGGFEIQGIGHGDLIEDDNGNWWLLCLGFRQIGQWEPFHHLGREVFLTPVTFGEDGWFTAGNGTTEKEYETDRIADTVVQRKLDDITFENTDWKIKWCHLRIPNMDNYTLEKDKAILRGTDISLDKADSPTFIGIRQQDFKAEITCDVSVDKGEAGITIYMDENHHYDLAIRQTDSGYEVIERLNVGDIKSVEKSYAIKIGSAKLIINADNYGYAFSLSQGGEKVYLGSAQTRYLSTEVATGFTGVFIGLYAYDKDANNTAEFSNLRIEYK